MPDAPLSQPLTMEAGRSGPGIQHGVAASSAGFAVTLALLLTLFAASLTGLLPTRLTQGLDRRLNIAAVWPQGWSFFADTPDTEAIQAFRVNAAGQITGAALLPAMSADNTWGMGRRADARYLELLGISREVSGHYWVACTDATLASCLTRTAVQGVADPSHPALLCGALALVRGRLAPGGGHEGPTLVARVVSRCDS